MSCLSDFEDSDMIAGSSSGDESEDSIFNKSTQPAVDETIYDAETQRFLPVTDEIGDEDDSVILPTPNQQQVVDESLGKLFQHENQKCFPAKAFISLICFYFVFSSH